MANAYFFTKRILHNGSEVPILLQSQNGPCPLLSIANVLLLRGQLQLNERCRGLSAEQLCSLLGAFLVEKNQTDDEAKQERLNRCIEHFPKLLQGMDVDIKFDSITGFQPTTELSTYELFGVTLVHGWLSDPAEEQLHAVVSFLSYDQLVERAVMAGDTSGFESPIADSALKEAQLCKHWISKTQRSQLTWCGLDALQRRVKAGAVVAFFRNHHFFTMTKNEKGQLYLLVTEEAVAGGSSPIVWELLEDLRLDVEPVFVDELFRCRHASFPRAIP